MKKHTISPIAITTKTVPIKDGVFLGTKRSSNFFNDVVFVTVWRDKENVPTPATVPLTAETAEYEEAAWYCRDACETRDREIECDDTLMRQRNRV